jgi:plastocyanin
MLLSFKHLATLTLVLFVAFSASVHLATAEEGTTHTVAIKAFKFDPPSLNVKAGDKITWINEDLAPHTATAKDKSWDTGRLKKGQSKTIEVTADFSLDYFCRFHPNMKAALQLEP